MQPPAFCRLSVVPELGIEQLSARFYGHAFDRHFHDDYAIGVTFDGVQTFNARGARQVSTPGTAIAFDPGEVHDGEAGDAVGFCYRMFYLPEALVRDTLAEGGERGLPHFAEPLSRDRRLVGAVLAMARALDRGEPMAGETALLRLVRAMGRAGTDAPRNIDRHAVTRARDMLADRQAEPVSIAELAAATGLPRFRLIRAFTARYGLPPHAYLMSLRLNAAQRRLRAGEPPAAVAAACGFTDQAHLTREFRRRLGATPGAYRGSSGTRLARPVACSNSAAAPSSAASPRGRPTS